MHRLLRRLRVSALFGMGLFLLPSVLSADPVVIVHPSSGIERLTRQDVTNIFMGRQRRLPSGAVALPVEQARPGEIKSRFYQLLLRKSLPEVNAYWARLLFSGQAQPPRQARSVEEVLNFVAENPGAVGVVDGARVDRRVRVALEFGR